MKNLKIHLYKGQKAIPEKTVTIPFSVIHIATKLLPVDLEEALNKEEIDILQCQDLAKEKGLIGTLIEIENSDKRMVISVE